MKNLFFLTALLCAAFASDKWAGEGWQKQTNQDKASALWSQITSDKTSGSFPSIFKLAGLFLESMDTSFDTVADDLPYQDYLGLIPRYKLIHSVGAIAVSKFVITNNFGNYTGIFSSGSDYSFIRFSLAADPGSNPFTPGISFKAMRSNVPSGNVFAMFSLLGTPDSWNFFKHDMTNHAPDLGGSVAFSKAQLKKAFERASTWPVFIGLSDLASYDQSGNHVSKPKFPFRLIFHPNSKVHGMFPDEKPIANLQQQLETLNPQVLYDIYAEDKPGSTPVKLGYIEILTNPTASKWADQKMFFQHTRFEDDLVHRPEWAPLGRAILEKQRAVTAYSYPDLPWN